MCYLPLLGASSSEAIHPADFEVASPDLLFLWLGLQELCAIHSSRSQQSFSVSSPFHILGRGNKNLLKMRPIYCTVVVTLYKITYHELYHCTYGEVTYCVATYY